MRKPKSTKPTRPTMQQTTIRIPADIIEFADTVVAERGGLLDRSDILREMLMLGRKAIEGKKQ
jgi:hypothetical protein